MSQAYDYTFIGYGDYLVYKKRDLQTGQLVQDAVRWNNIKHITVKEHLDPIKLSISLKSADKFERLNFPMKDWGNVKHFIEEACKAGVTLVPVPTKHDRVAKFKPETSLSAHISHTGTWESAIIESDDLDS